MLTLYCIALSEDDVDKNINLYTTYSLVHVQIYKKELKELKNYKVFKISIEEIKEKEI